MKSMIKKMTIVAGCMLASTAMMAQVKSLSMSSVAGSNVQNYDGQVRNVTLYRSVYTGWNTLCVPFSMTTEELNEAFGAACQLEALEGVTRNGETYYLNFRDVKEEGVKANTPYILYYTGETKSAKVIANETTIEYVANPSQAFKVDGVTIAFNGAVKQLDANGQYGIYVKDNQEARFSKVDDKVNTSGFYATRCFVTVEGAAAPELIVRHNPITAEATAISNIKAESAKDVYSINGTRQSNVQKGVNVVNGKKVYVK